MMIIICGALTQYRNRIGTSPPHDIKSSIVASVIHLISSISPASVKESEIARNRSFCDSATTIDPPIRCAYHIINIIFIIITTLIDPLLHPGHAIKERICVRWYYYDWLVHVKRITLDLLLLVCMPRYLMLRNTYRNFSSPGTRHCHHCHHHPLRVLQTERLSLSQSNRCHYNMPESTRNSRSYFIAERVSYRRDVNTGDKKLCWQESRQVPTYYPRYQVHLSVLHIRVSGRLDW